MVARFSSFTRAADLLHLTQPALTVQIRQLEQALGVKLFDRSTRAVELTRIGRELLPVLERLLGNSTRSSSAPGKWRPCATGLYALPLCPPSPQPCCLLSSPASSSGIHISASPSGIIGERINAMVREEIVDFGIGSDVEPDAELETVPLFEDEMRAVVPASHPLGKQTEVMLDRLIEEPLILMDTRSSVRSLVDRAFADREHLAVPA